MMQKDIAKRREFFEEYDIDPYKVCGLDKSFIYQDDALKILKKQYNKKLLLVHPDKTGSNTDVEFNILQECYLYLAEIASDIRIQIPEQDHHQMRNNAITVAATPSQTKSRTIYNTNFHDPEIRKKLFVDDDLPDLKDFEDRINKPLIPEQDQIDEVKDYREFFKGDSNKFENKKFNAVFDSLKKSKTKSQALIKIDQVIPFNATSEFAEIAFHNGIILEKKNKSKNLKHFEKSPDESFVPDDDIINLTKNEGKMKKLIKAHAKNTGKLSKKALSSLEEKQRQAMKKTMDDPPTGDFKKLKEQMIEDSLRTMKREMIENREHILKHPHVYQSRELYDQGISGLLQSSSTCISGNDLIIPQSTVNMRYLT